MRMGSDRGTPLPNGVPLRRGRGRVTCRTRAGAGTVATCAAKNTDPASCRVRAGRVEERRRSYVDWLTDEGEVVITTRGVRDGGAAVGGDAQQGLVGDGAAINTDRADRVANADGAAGIATAVDIAQRNRAAIGGSGTNAAVPRRSGLCELHDSLPSLVPTCAWTGVTTHGSSAAQSPTVQTPRHSSTRVQVRQVPSVTAARLGFSHPGRYH